MAKNEIARESIKSLTEDIAECKAMIFDIKDNHLKEIRERLSTLEGKLTMLVWIIPVSFTLIGIVLIFMDRFWK